MKLSSNWASNMCNSLSLVGLDNCGPHKTAVVEQAFQEAGWKAMFLPPNMTHILQPMHLIVNSVLKSAMRRHRIQHLMGYFKQYRADYHNALRGHRDLPMYNPPAPTIIDGIKGMFDLAKGRVFAE